jgi:hypothetical protein
MTPKQFLKAYKKHGSVKAVARNTGLTYYAARKVYAQAVEEGLINDLGPGAKNKRQLKDPESDFKEPVIEGSTKALKTKVFDIPKKGVKRYLFTCAQNNTELHGPLWENLKVLAKHYKAKINIARFTYVKSGLGARGDKAQITTKEKLYGAKDMVWVPEIYEHLSDERIEVAPGLVWCGEMNILPTAIRPLSGLEVYTGRKSGIFPHVKIALESIASGRDEGTKFNYTTGTITKRNYIQRKAGLKAEFHHCYGALLVEVDSDGDWFARQINGDSRGTIYDLDICVKEGVLSEGNRPKAILWGDVHEAEIDKDLEELIWSELGMLNQLKPEEQHMGDVLAFRSKSHHEIKNPHIQFKRYVEDQFNVQKEVERAGSFLVRATRDWCSTIVVDSNHHHHLGRWLMEQNGLYDPVNAEFWLLMQTKVYECIRKGEEPIYIDEAFKALDFRLPVIFLEQDESHIICPDANGGIECGMHGDLGPNGSRGGALQFAKMGRKANTGHTHQARIVDGIYVSGTCSLLNPDWTRGPGAWSHSHVLTYQNGKRTIITCWNGKYKAE